jgi:hypothetical protein
MGPGAVDMAGSAGEVGRCTSGRARATPTAVGSPKREEHGAQKARVAHVAWPVRWVVCTRVGAGENGREGQQAEEEASTPTRSRVYHEEAKRWVRYPGRGEGNAAPAGVGNSPDKAHDAQTLVGYGAVDGVADGEEGAEC